VPTRPGNWLFHCHLVDHIDGALRLAKEEPKATPSHANHAEQAMAGLVLGVQVSPRKGATTALAPVARRTLRLFVDERANVYGDKPGYSFVLQDGPVAPAADSVRVPSSTIVLHRGEPTEITVINRMKRHATIHWHGIELQSFYDGVGDWSGLGTTIAPPIAPNDSFVVRLTADRAGTFIYHTHTDETEQLSSGLYGPLLVLAENAPRDTTERVFLMGAGGPQDEAPPFVNGRASPPPIELRAGIAHRFRFINIAPAGQRRVRLLGDSAERWRAVAKDGADLPPQQATTRPAVVLLLPGETYDFEVRRQKAGTLTLEITAGRGPVLPPVVTRIPVIVR
jgi:FtsP/CotA-like multicopper oxidase with cupredoxin domain